MNLAEFHFLRPYWLLMLIPLAWICWRLRRPAGDGGAWQQICDPHLLPHLLVRETGREDRWRLWLLGLGWLLAVLALAGPTWSQRPQPVFRNLEARIIVLDLSNSMAAADLKPSRLTRARFKVADMLTQWNEGLTGLVVFAGDAFTVSPLTHDNDTIAALLPVLGPELMPTQGSRVDLGLRKAAELLQQAGINRGEILLVADGDNDHQTLDIIAELNNQGYRISVLAVGTEAGAPIPVANGGFLKDAAGNIVVPRLDTAHLQSLSRAGGGRYALISADSTDLETLLINNSVNPLSASEQADRQTDSWREEGPWLVLILLPLAALAFRRGWLVG